MLLRNSRYVTPNTDVAILAKICMYVPYGKVFEPVRAFISKWKNSQKWRKEL